MIISEFNHLEVVTESASVEGGLGQVRSYFEYDQIAIDFNSYNSFYTKVNSPETYSNSASAGAKGDAINPYSGYVPTHSYTKADTLAVTEYLGGSFSASTSAAVINRAHRW